jgi:hypothetical protein
MPVETQNTTEGLKPERVSKPAQHFLGPVFTDDNLNYGSPKLLHFFEKPGRTLTTVQRLFDYTGTHYFSAPSLKYLIYLISNDRTYVCFWQRFILIWH